MRDWGTEGLGDWGTEGPGGLRDSHFSMILKILLSDDGAEGPDWETGRLGDWGTGGLKDWGTEGLGD